MKKWSCHSVDVRDRGPFLNLTCDIEKKAIKCVCSMCVVCGVTVCKPYLIYLLKLNFLDLIE